MAGLTCGCCPAGRLIKARKRQTLPCSHGDVVHAGQQIWAIEVKSGSPRGATGLDAFRRNYPAARVLQLGGGGIPIERFFSHDPMEYFRA